MHNSSILNKNDNFCLPFFSLFLPQKTFVIKEILASLIGALFAAFDTTSATLGFCIYCLLKNPEAMAKLQEEIDTLESVRRHLLFISLIICLTEGDNSYFKRMMSTMRL